MAAAATLNTVTQEIKEGNSQNASWHAEERGRQAARDALIANSSAAALGSVSWLTKIFGGQSKARKEAAEAAREAARKPGGAPGGGGGFGAGLTAGKGGILGKTLGGLFKFLGMLIKGPFKIIGWLARIPMMLASVTALWVGLAALVGFFALVTVASMTMGEKDFDKLKKDIADGVAGAISKVVAGAMKIWNSFVPDSWKISPEAQKAFTEGTFKAVSETIVAVIDFAKNMGTSFNEGFKGQLDGFKKSWETFKKVFDKIVKVFEGTMEGTGGKAEAGLMTAAKKVGEWVGKIGTFFLDLFSALGAEALGEDAKTDNKFLNTAAKIIVKIIKFIGDIVANFAGGFMENFDGIAAQFTLFKEKIGLIADKIGGWFTTLGKSKGGETEETILGVFSLLGGYLAKFYESIFKVLNFVADLIIDPTVTLAKAQVSIEDAFQTMGQNIAEFMEGIFNKESMLLMLKAMLGESATGRATFAAVENLFGTVEEAAAEREKDMVREGERLRTKNTIMEKSAKETDRQLQEQLKLGDDRDDATVRRLQLALAREQAEIERNKGALEKINDNIAVSEEVQIQAEIDAKMGEEATAAERKNRVLKKELAQLEEGAMATGFGQVTGMAGLREENIGFAGFEAASFSVEDFEKMSARIGEISGGKITAADIASGQAQLSQDMISMMKRFGIKEGQIDDAGEQTKIFSAGLKRMEEIAAKQAEIDAKKLILAETEVELAKKRKEIEINIRKKSTGQTGGLVLEGGLAEIHQGELLIDNASAVMMLTAGKLLSGVNLMDLQRESLAGQAAGSSAVTVVNNSSQQINQSRPMILPPSPILPGNGGSTLAAA